MTAPFDLTVIQEGEVFIIPLHPSHCDEWAKILGLVYQSLSTIPAHDTTTLEFVRQFGLSEFAIISTDFFGGAGSHGAAVYRDGTCIYLAEHYGPTAQEPKTPKLTFVERIKNLFVKTPEIIVLSKRKTLYGSHINKALDILGLEPSLGKDLFETAGLHKYRQFDDLFDC